MLNQRWKKYEKKETKKLQQTIPNVDLEKHKNDKLSGNLEDTIAFIKKYLGENDDFYIHHFRVFGKFQAAIIFLSSLVDKRTINLEVLKPLMYIPQHLEGKTIEQDQVNEILLNDILYNSQGILEDHLADLIDVLLFGRTVVLIEGINEAITIETLQVDKRSIEQPPTDQVIRGPRDGFIESLQTNLALIRFRLHSPDFRVKITTTGKESKVKVGICYIKGIAHPDLVKEVNDRISAIEIDAVLDVGYLEQLIEDHHFSPFPQIANTERPDKVVAQMLEGRVCILIDGSPFALIVPAVFTQFYQSTEDYSERFLMGTLVRIIRLVALLFALVFTSLYVSIISFNPELIPTDFAVAVAGGRAGVPFPTVIEVLIMEISMEVLREATIRLPQQVGGALSIVGVLVIGQAAVSAGFVSPITVVVIALTTIGSFATPAYNAAIALRMLRFPLVILAGIFGLYGVMVGLILIINHMLSLKSFGVPYMAPIVPGNFEGMKDTLIRAPLWWMPKRPSFFHSDNKTRLSKDSLSKIKEPPSNTLDPMKVGNERWDDTDGISSTNNSDPSDDRHI